MNPLPTVNRPAVSNADCENEKDFVSDCVNDSVVSDADTPKVLSTHELLCSGRTRILRQDVDPSGNPSAFSLIQIGELAGGGGNQLDTVAAWVLGHGLLKPQVPL